MKNWVLAIAGGAVMVVSGCDNMSNEGRVVAGATGGAAAGLIAAEAFDADSDWKLISALAGAAAGTAVAQNSRRNTCAYARGDGSYYEAPCR